MKKRIFLLLSFVALLALQADAQIISAIVAAAKKATPHYTPGIVVFKDGHEQAYRWVQIPRQDMKGFKVAEDEKHKKPIDLNPADIAAVVIWSEALPEKKVTLIHIEAEKSDLPFYKTYPTEAWGYPIASSAWGTVFKCNYGFYINKKTGELEAEYAKRTSSMGNTMYVEEVAAGCYLWCADFEKPQLIGGSHSGTTRMQWAGVPKRMGQFFASNPQLAQRIVDCKITGEDIQYILDEMAAFHHLDGASQTEDFSDQETTTVSTEQTVSNGTVGDDE